MGLLHHNDDRMNYHHVAGNDDEQESSSLVLEMMSCSATSRRLSSTTTTTTTAAAAAEFGILHSPSNTIAKKRISRTIPTTPMTRSANMDDNIMHIKLPVFDVDDIETCCDSTKEFLLTEPQYALETDAAADDGNADADDDEEYATVPPGAEKTSSTTTPTISSSAPPPLRAYLLLASAVLSLSAIGPFLNRQGDGVDGTLKIYWRTTATCVVLLPFVMYTVAREGFPWSNMSPWAWLSLFLAAANYGAACVFFEWALERTSVGNALILSNCQSLLLLIGKWYMGTVPIRLWEGIGAVVAFVGAALCSTASVSSAAAAAAASSSSSSFMLSSLNNNDPPAATDLYQGNNVTFLDNHLYVDSSTTTTMMNGGDANIINNDDAIIWLTAMGDCYAFLSALAGIGYLVLTRTVRPLMNVYLFMFGMTLFSSLQILCFMYFCGGAPSVVSSSSGAAAADHDEFHLTFDLDPHHGAWGWLQLTSDRLPLELIMVLICNVFGAMGYVRAMQYFDNVVISVAALSEPVVAELMNCAMSGSALPSWMGWWGNLLVACGTFAVVYQPPTTAAIITTSSSNPNNPKASHTHVS